MPLGGIFGLVDATPLGTTWPKLQALRKIRKRKNLRVMTRNLRNARSHSYYNHGKLRSYLYCRCTVDTGSQSR
jgi:hypothetical protein